MNLKSETITIAFLSLISPKARRFGGGYLKQNYILLLLFLLVACTKDLELPYEKPDQTIVVNCLFSEGEPWKVILTRVKSYNERADPFVEDVRVMIVPENNDTIHLASQKDGIYSSNAKPISGVQYQLIVLDSKGNTTTAQSSIPVKPIISAIKPSTQNTIYYSNARLSDYEVLPLDFKISANDQPNFVRFRIFNFNTKRGYTRYMVTTETITELRKWKFPEDFLSELEKLIGKSMNSYEYFGIISEIAGK
jgi:hypothetical protein